MPQRPAPQRVSVRSWLGVVLLLPFGLVAELAWWFAVLTGREPAMVEAAPNLYFDRRLRRGDRSKAAACGFQGCLDLTSEFSEAVFLRQLPGYRVLPILDGTAPTNEQLRDAVEWLTSATSREPVYVHCALGHGRTGTVVIAYLLAHRLDDSLETAPARLRSIRPGSS